MRKRGILKYLYLLLYNMPKQDLKKINHAEERSKIAEDIVSIRNLKSFSQEKKKELIQGLLVEKELTQTPVEKACPFSQHKGYAELWKSLTLDQQKQMKENIKITADGKVEITKMKKKFSQFTAQHNGKNILDGSYVDKYWKTGIAGITYLTGRAAEQEAKNQGKKLFKNRSEVEQFVDFFPGENIKEKIFNVVKLFGLEKAACCVSGNEWPNYVGDVGYFSMSEVVNGNGVFGIGRNNDDAGIYCFKQLYPSPFLVFEDC